MDIKTLEEIINQGEGTTIEFKESTFELNKNTFETICAFLNNKGGHLILGVKDDGQPDGILPERLEIISNNLANLANNSQNLNPVFFLAPEILEYKGASIIYTYIPESPQVHRFKSRIFLRNGDKDFDITNNNLEVFELYLRKKFYRTEEIVIPEIQIDDFETTSFELARKLVSITNPDHPWIRMSNLELLCSSGLFRKNHFNGKNGFTLASVLIFGKEEVIRNILPFYKTELRFECQQVKFNEYQAISENLLNSFFLIKSFCEKHLMYKTYRSGDPASNRDISIFNELICNLLIHREYSNPYPGQVIITEDKIMTQNWNLPFLDKFYSQDYPTSIAKNPKITRIFSELGLARDLGSGIKKLISDSVLHTPDSVPVISESNIFIVEVPLYDKEVPLFEVSHVNDLCEDECIIFHLTITRDLSLQPMDRALPPYTIGYKINGYDLNLIQIYAFDETQPGSGIYEKTLEICENTPKIHRFEFEYINQNKNQIGSKKQIRYVKVYDIPIINIQEKESVRGLSHHLRADYRVIHDYPSTSLWTCINGPGIAIIDGNSVRVDKFGLYTFNYTVVNGPCMASSETTINFHE